MCQKKGRRSKGSPHKYVKGSCRFQEYCKYDHEDQINTNELLEKIRNLENEKKKILEMYENHFEKYSNKNEDRNGEEAIKM